MIEDLNSIFERPTCTVQQLGRLLGLSKNSAYAAVQRGDFACIRVEGRILVLTAPLRRMLSLDLATEDTQLSRSSVRENRRPLDL